MVGKKSKDHLIPSKVKTSNSVLAFQVDTTYTGNVLIVRDIIIGYHSYANVYRIDASY